jgi:hypothetical protein
MSESPTPYRAVRLSASPGRAERLRALSFMLARLRHDMDFAADRIAEESDLDDRFEAHAAALRGSSGLVGQWRDQIEDILEA